MDGTIGLILVTGFPRMHWMVVVTYVVAIGAIAMLMIGAG